MLYEYTSYSDIPANIMDYVMNVACLDDIHELSLEDINIFLNETSDFYQSNGQSFQDFLDD